ncbi:MAG: hypothetical protein KJ768_09310, partial [Acidobacteria bacterium]|nr:hypothetical protein [Acidobacteriota bacterium]
MKIIYTTEIRKCKEEILFTPKREAYFFLTLLEVERDGVLTRAEDVDRLGVERTVRELELELDLEGVLTRAEELEVVRDGVLTREVEVERDGVLTRAED